MAIKTLVKKMQLSDKKFITREELKEDCKKLSLDYYAAIRYLTHYKYLVRILRGIFYIKSIEERKLNKTNINHLEAIKEALAIKGVRNWYFGLSTALKLNNLTHEYFAIDYVISDNLFRARPFCILGYKIKFIKISPKLTKFGIINKKLPYSDPEKTILDYTYLKEHGNIKLIPEEIFKNCSKTKLLKYSKNYDKRTIKRLTRWYD
jgi:hypothetical protein